MSMIPWLNDNVFCVKEKSVPGDLCQCRAQCVLGTSTYLTLRYSAGHVHKDLKKGLTAHIPSCQSLLTLKMQGKNYCLFPLM